MVLFSQAGQPADDADRFAQAYKGMRADPAIQFNLPPPKPEPKPPAWLEAVGKWLREHIFEPIGKALQWVGGFFPDAPYARIFLWTVLALAAVALAWAIYNRVRHGEWRLRLPRLAPVTDIADDEIWSPDETPIRLWLEEADALAAQGKYAEAIHHLLFRSIEDIASRRPNLVRPGTDQPGNRRVPGHSIAGRRAVRIDRPAGRTKPVRGTGGRRGRLGRSTRRLYRFRPRQGVARMSEIAIGKEAQEGPFKARAMLLVVAIGTVAFIAMLVLGAYAPDLRSGHNGGSHALSNAATGFSGLVRLAEATGRRPLIVRSEDQLKSEDLVVITPEHGWTDLSEILALRGSRATLIVLPKWETVPDGTKPGWVRVSGLLPPLDPGRTLAPAFSVGVARARTKREPLISLHPGAGELQFFAPVLMQTISNPKLKPLVTDRSGHILLGQVDDRPLYLLADPDLVNNHGMADERQAKAALAMLDFLNSTDADLDPVRRHDQWPRPFAKPAQAGVRSAVSRRHADDLRGLAAGCNPGADEVWRAPADRTGNQVRQSGPGRQ